MSESLGMPSACVASLYNSTSHNKPVETQTLDSFVTVVDYPEFRPSLLELFKKYRDVITLPEESLDVTDKTEPYIKLKPGSQPVYIPAYRLPHIQRQVVAEAIDEMLEEGVLSAFPLECCSRNKLS